MSDPVLQLPSSFINNCETVYYDIFFSLKTLINFLVSLLVTLLTRLTERNNRPEVFKVVLENIVIKYFDKFQWKLLRSIALLNKRQCFPIFFCEIVNNTFILDCAQETLAKHLHLKNTCIRKFSKQLLYQQKLRR